MQLIMLSVIPIQPISRSPEELALQLSHRDLYAASLRCNTTYYTIRYYTIL